MPIVLLVEDDRDVRTLIQTALAERGIDVRIAGDDKTAQRILEQHAQQVSVLIADINLGGGGSGIDVARRARRLNPRVEVVYITGEELRIDKLGGEGGVLLPKPFNLDALVEMAEALAT
jgi:two-component system OmpR family response regulator